MIDASRGFDQEALTPGTASDIVRKTSYRGFLTSLGGELNEGQEDLSWLG